MLAGLCVLLLGAGEARAQRGLPGQLGIGLSMGTLDGLLLRDSRLCYRYWRGWSSRATTGTTATGTSGPDTCTRTTPMTG